MLDHFTNCNGCQHLERDASGAECGKGMQWHEPVPIKAFCFKATPDLALILRMDDVTLYEHPDGEGRIAWDPLARCLVVSSEVDDVEFQIEIGPQGLRELGKALLDLAKHKEAGL